MCHSDVQPAAHERLAEVLTEMRMALARTYYCDPETINIGPVDFGTKPANDPP